MLFNGSHLSLEKWGKKKVYCFISKVLLSFQSRSDNIFQKTRRDFFLYFLYDDLQHTVLVCIGSDYGHGLG